MGAFDRWKQYRIGWVFESGKDVSSAHGAGKAPALELFMGFGVLLGDNTTAMTEISNFETLRPDGLPQDSISHLHLHQRQDTAQDRSVLDMKDAPLGRLCTRKASPLSNYARAQTWPGFRGTSRARTFLDAQRESHVIIVRVNAVVC